MSHMQTKSVNISKIRTTGSEKRNDFIQGILKIKSVETRTFRNMCRHRHVNCVFSMEDIGSPNFLSNSSKHNV